MDALYHMLRLEVLHPKLFSFARDGVLPLFWKNLTLRSHCLKPSELLSFTGRTVLIAGATSGCGLEVAKLLAKECAHLIITARDPKRGEQAVKEIHRSLPEDNAEPQIEVWPLDFESFQSIRDFTQRLQGLQSLDVAILNAGIWHLHFAKSADDFETHLQVNYLASCALSLSLLKVLARGRSPPKTSPGRLMIVTSEGHSLETVPNNRTASEVLESFNDPKSLSCYQRYRFSKLLSMIWTHELASSIDSAAKGVEVASFTPGGTRTQICRDLGTGFIVRMVMNAFCQPTEEGAWTYVRALNAEVYHGQYFFRGRPDRPTDCVTAHKFKSIRHDLVLETITMLRNHVPIPFDIEEWLV